MLWQVVASIRITTLDHNNEGYRLNPFRIKVGNTLCRTKKRKKGLGWDSNLDDPAEWHTAYPGTGDFTCYNGPLTGSDVTISLKGTGRILQLCEVQVFEPFDPTTFHVSHDCYEDDLYDAENAYPHMKSCKTCVGPGPTQCTSCDPGSAFVPWRNHAQEGSCHQIAEEMQSQVIANGFESETTLAKWGLQKLKAVTLSASSALREVEVKQVVVVPVCALQKSMRCVNLDANTTKCDVWKSGALQRVHRIMLDQNQALIKHVRTVVPETFHVRTNIDKHSVKFKSKGWFMKMPNDVPYEINKGIKWLKELVEVPNINDVCAAAVQLL